MNKTMTLAILALPLLACSASDDSDGANGPQTESDELRASAAENQFASAFRAQVTALPAGAAGLGEGRCTTVGTRPKMTFTVYHPKVTSPGANVVVGTRFEAPGTPTQELLIDGSSYQIVFRGYAYGVQLTLGGQAYLLEVYETEGTLRSATSDDAVPLRCEYAL